MPIYVFKCEDGHKIDVRMSTAQFIRVKGDADAFIFCDQCGRVAKNEIQPVNFYVNHIHDRILPNGSFDTYDDRIPDMYDGAV